MLTVWNAFNDLFRDEEFWNRPLSREHRDFVPAVDVSENEKAFVLRADVPGMKPEEIDVSVDKNVLTLKGARSYENKEEKEGFHRVERRYGSFQRSFVLPESVNAEAIEASVENGTLTIFIPKAEASAPKKIKVGAGGLADKARKLFTKSGGSEGTQPRAS